MRTWKGDLRAARMDIIRDDKQGRSTIMAMIMAAIVMAVAMTDADADTTDMHTDDGGIRRAGTGAEKRKGKDRGDERFHVGLSGASLASITEPARMAISLVWQPESGD
jgi:hypothetical protein